MKIQPDIANAATPASGAVDRTDTSGRVAENPAVGKPAQDQLTLSAEVEVAREALTQAAGLPEIRDNQVERLRALLARGEVGNDPGRLADALIDALLAHPVDE